MRLDYGPFRVEPLSGSGGAEVVGVDLSRLDSNMFAHIKQAFLDHLLLVFRDQQLSDDQIEAVGKHFSPLVKHEFVTPIEGHPNLISIRRLPDESREVGVAGEDWHWDAPWLERPVAGAVLACLECPPYGGDTQFANLYQAYDRLSDGMKKIADTLILISDAPYDPAYNAGLAASAAMEYDLASPENLEFDHPLVRINPDSGRRALTPSGPPASRFVGLTADESRPLIDFFTKHATRGENTFRVRWRAGTVAIWDNRCLMHQALADYQGFGRHMRRVQFSGERPFGPAKKPSDEDNIPDFLAA